MNKNKILSFVLLCAALFTISACHDDDNNSPVIKKRTKYFISVKPSSLKEFSANGEKQTITVAAKKIVETFVGDEHQKDKDVVSNAEFTAKTEGEGFSQEIKDSTITITASENQTYSIRSGVLTISVKDDNSQFAKLELKQFSKNASGFPDNHVFLRLAEYNIGKTPKNFANNHNNDQSGYYKWEDAKTACPDGYRLPSREELTKFVPDYGNKYPEFNASGIAYLIIGKDADRVAYRYKKAGKFLANNLESHLEITGRYLGNTHNETTEKTISDENWWKKDNNNDIVRILPCAGFFFDGVALNVGTIGMWWTSSKSETDEDYAWTMDFPGLRVAHVDGHSKNNLISVRCIKN